MRTRPTKPRLLNEGGVTRTSLKNAKRLEKRLGLPVRIELHRHPNGPEWYVVTAMYEHGDEHDFTGFSWGYNGEGPTGLLEFLKRSGVDIEIKDIILLRESKEGLVWSWPQPRKVGS
jgi:hypothetical protein